MKTALSLSCPCVNIWYDLIRFNSEKYRSTEAVVLRVTKISRPSSNTSWNADVKSFLLIFLTKSYGLVFKSSSDVYNSFRSLIISNISLKFDSYKFSSAEFGDSIV